jgi:uncharacterized membrane protein (DUF2068 family)
MGIGWLRPTLRTGQPPCAGVILTALRRRPGAGSFRATARGRPHQHFITALPTSLMSGAAGTPSNDPRPSRAPGVRSLRLIASFKLVQSLLLTGLALAALHLLRPDIAADVQDWIGDMPLKAQEDLLLRGLSWLLNLPRGHAKLLAVAALLYALLFAVEGIGLWHGKRWAEWLTVIATSSFIPLEIWELFHRPGTIKSVVLVVNVLVVWLLIRALARPAEPRAT